MIAVNKSTRDSLRQVVAYWSIKRYRSIDVSLDPFRTENVLVAFNFGRYKYENLCETVVKFTSPSIELSQWPEIQLLRPFKNCNSHRSEAELRTACDTTKKKTRKKFKMLKKDD